MMDIKRMIVLGCVAVCIAGCEGISEDFSSLTEDLMPPSPREAAEDMIDPYDPEKRRRGTTLIANSPFGGSEVYVRAYADKVQNEENPLALAAAIRALARHGEPEHAILIAGRLAHESQQVRWEAARGLQRLHNPDVVPILLAVARDRNEEVDVRNATIVALGQYPQDRVFQLLVSPAALDARELVLNVSALGALRTLTGQDFGREPRQWLAWYNRADAPFADGSEYLYPTYTRAETFGEKIAFWSSNHWETPQPPAGLNPRGMRSTYDELVEDETNAPDEG